MSQLTDIEMVGLAKYCAKLREEWMKKKESKNVEAPIAPAYFPEYMTMVEDYEAVRIHAVKHVFPDKLFAKRAPNQTEEEWAYTRANYKQVTLPIFMDYVSQISRAFLDNNWKIEYAEEPDKYNDVDSEDPNVGFRDYVEGKIEKWGSIENWFKRTLPTIKSIDPNGVVAVKPLPLETYLEEAEDGTIQERVDESMMLRPQPVYYNVRQVVQREIGEWYLIETNEKSEVAYGNKTVKEGLIYEYYDRNTIWRIIQVGKKTEFQFEAVPYFVHELGYVPLTHLLGVPVVTDTSFYYQSPFLYACDNLDLVALNSSNLQLSINNCVYPVKVMVGNECDFVNETGARCIDGYIGTGEGKKVCPSCNGSGMKHRTSPVGTFLLRPKSTTDEGDTGFTQPLYYVAPDTTSLEFLRSKIAEDEGRARRILRLSDNDIVVQSSPEAPTATESHINNKDKYAFIKPISSEMFSIVEFILDTTMDIRYGKDEIDKPVVYEPQTFDFTTEGELMNEISRAIQSGLPPFVVHSLIYKYLSSVYYTEKETMRVFKLLLHSDRLLTHSDDEVANMLAQGLAAPYEAIIHQSGIHIIMELEQEDENFWEKDLEDQRKAVEEKAVAKATELEEYKPKYNPFPEFVPPAV